MAEHSRKPRLIVVIGPTAAGKTELSIALAPYVGGAVVSADSRQVYAEMNIGTAKPQQAWIKARHDVLTPDIVDEIPHYLLNIRHPDTTLTLAEWQQASFLVIDHLHTSDMKPLLVGGTMLYVDSVIYNYTIPSVQPSSTLRAELAQRDTPLLYRELMAKDPAARHFIEPHHKQRIIRALEVMAVSGRLFSAQRRVGSPRYTVTIIGIFPGWTLLEQRIRTRAHEMLCGGLLEETQQLIEHYSGDMPLLNTMNYAQARRVLAGNLSQEEAVQEMVRVNMRYAHRQMSWWKSRNDVTWITSVSDLTTVLRSVGELSL